MHHIQTLWVNFHNIKRSVYSKQLSVHWASGSSINTCVGVCDRIIIIYLYTKSLIDETIVSIRNNLCYLPQIGLVASILVNLISQLVRSLCHNVCVADAQLVVSVRVDVRYTVSFEHGWLFKPDVVQMPQWSVSWAASHDNKAPLDMCTVQFGLSRSVKSV